MSLKRLSELFDSAIAIESAKERNAFIERECEHDETVRAELFALIQAHFGGGKLLELPVVSLDFLQGASFDDLETEGALVGSYKLLKKLGEGGMGVVFMAEQLEPIRRIVALKIVRHDFHSRTVLTRFELERESLSRLEHPHVTRILDAGVTASGRPFFVMELVRGTNIIQYCKSADASIADRVRLLEQVCLAIHHVHQKGIIHRDIKPSNVMIAMNEGVAVPKVIDFGIAKALDRPSSDTTLFTRPGEMMGTPQYMSPEQAEMSDLDLDVRTDIFSLGVLLYELLTGTTPITSEQINGQGLLKVFENIRDCQAEIPSVRAARTVASTTGTMHVSGHPVKRFARELDWITMKAIAKDRNQRYDSAAAMAKDLRRFLNGEPVEAAAPSIAYVYRKYFQKHKTVAIVAAAASALLIASTEASLYWAVASSTSAQLAQARLTELSRQSRALESQKNKAESALERALVAEERAESLARAERRRATNSRAANRYFRESTAIEIRKVVDLARGEKTSPETGRLQQDPAMSDNVSAPLPTAPLPSGRTSVEASGGSIAERLELLIQHGEGFEISSNVDEGMILQRSEDIPERFYEIEIEELRAEFGNEDIFLAQKLTEFASLMLQNGDSVKARQAEKLLGEAIAIYDLNDTANIDLLESTVLLRKACVKQNKTKLADELTAKSLSLSRQLEMTGLNETDKLRVAKLMELDPR